MTSLPPPLPGASEGPPPLPSDEKPSNDLNAEPPHKKIRKSRFDDKPPAKDVAQTIAQKFNTNPLLTFQNDIVLDLEVPDAIVSDPMTNFVGMMIGPGGSTQRTMEAQTGAKITVRGRGSTRDGTDMDGNRPMFVRVQGKVQDHVDAAAAVIRELLTDSTKRDALREQQMRQRDAQMTTTTYSTANFPPTTFQAFPGGEVMMIAAAKVGIVIGRNGETIKLIQAASGAHVQVQREHSTEHPDTREVQVQGTPEQIAQAKDAILKYLSGGGERLPAGPLPPEDDSVMVPNNVVGIIIGRGGETIKRLQQDTECKIQVTPEVMSPAGATERKLILNGTVEQCRIAKYAIEDLVEKHRDTPYVHQGIGHDIEIVSIPSGCIGILIGKGGESVKQMAMKTHTRIQVQKDEEQQLPDGSFPNPEYRTVSIRGDRPSIDAAKGEIQAIIDEHASRHGYEAPQLNSKTPSLPLGTLGMEPEQYKQYIEQMQQYYGMNEQQIHDYYKQAMQQAAADPAAYQQLYAQQLAAYQQQVGGAQQPAMQQPQMQMMQGQPGAVNPQQQPAMSTQDPNLALQQQQQLQQQMQLQQQQQLQQQLQQQQLQQQQQQQLQQQQQQQLQQQMQQQQPGMAPQQHNMGVPQQQPWNQQPGGSAQGFAPQQHTSDPWNQQQQQQGSPQQQNWSGGAPPQNGPPQSQQWQGGQQAPQQQQHHQGGGGNWNQQDAGGR